MKLQKIEITELSDGDIIYIDLNNGLNNDLIGSDYLVTGTDVVFIVDCASMSYDNHLVVNGGHHIILEENQTIFKIGHYSELIKQLNN